MQKILLSMRNLLLLLSCSEGETPINMSNIYLCESANMHRPVSTAKLTTNEHTSFGKLRQFDAVN